MNEDIITHMTIIAGRKQKDALLKELLNSGVHFINTIYAKGTVSSDYLHSTLGLVPEKNKVVITCVSTCVKIEAVIDILNKKFRFNEPNTGIVFTMPVDKFSFL